MSDMDDTTGASGLGDTLGTIQECWRKNHILPQNAADWLISEVERLRAENALLWAFREQQFADVEPGTTPSYR